jgi:hypothetical protein
MRQRLHPEPWVTFAVDRNINTTNACASLCGFCAFARKPGDSGAWTLDRETLAAKIEELCAVSEHLTGENSRTNHPRETPADICTRENPPAAPLVSPRPIVLMQGGMSPALTLGGTRTFSLDARLVALPPSPRPFGARDSVPGA